MIEIPVFLNTREKRDRGRWITDSEATTLTLSEALLERSTAAFAALRELRKVRTRDHAPLSEQEKWHSMLQAVRAYLATGEAGAQLDELGRVRLQHAEGSDSSIATYLMDTSRTTTVRFLRDFIYMNNVRDGMKRESPISRHC